MKKVIFGGFMLLAGALGIAILAAATMAQPPFRSDALPASWAVSWALSIYGIMPVFCVFITIAVIGLIIGCWGLVDKKNKD